MPLYEFSCRKCGQSFEELMGMAEAAQGPPACPACGSKQTEKGFSAFATGSGTGGDSSAAGGCGRGGFT
jgi:putative FmdB family regulatory protein